MPISGDERYRITGRVPEHRLPENYFTLWNHDWNTVDVFDGNDLVLESDRTFEIFVDADDKGDRRNHIRSAPDALEFYIRDVLQDWSADTPNELSIERIGGAPALPALAFDEEAERVAQTMAVFASNTQRYNLQAYDKPVNSLEFTIDRDTDGALRNQVYILGHFRLEEEEALVIDVRLAGARYFIAPITNYWGTTNEIVDRTGCLNLSQSVRNADGTLTFVVSKHDPGVPNWLDPSDMGEGILTLRWAEFEGGRPGPDLGATSRVVPLARLRDHLPEETPSFDVPRGSDNVSIVPRPIFAASRKDGLAFREDLPIERRSATDRARCPRLRTIAALRTDRPTPSATSHGSRPAAAARLGAGRDAHAVHAPLLAIGGLPRRPLR